MIDLDFDDVDSVAYLPPDLLLRWWPGNQIPLYSQINTHKIGLSSSQADTIAAILMRGHARRSDPEESR